MFLNINELNLGEVSIGSYIKNKALTEEEKNKIVLLNEVIMPTWSRDNPYILNSIKDKNIYIINFCHSSDPGEDISLLICLFLFHKYTILRPTSRLASLAY